jgi:hypothetical protein
VTRISIISDLHLEFADLSGLPGGDILLLAGDIFTAAPMQERKNDAQSRSLRKRYIRFIRDELTKYQLVLYIAGNHEFYRSAFEEAPGLLRAFFAEHGGTVRYLEKEMVEIEGVVFLGTTLWASHGVPDPFKAARIGDGLNDFRLIKTSAPAGSGTTQGKGERNFRPEDAALEHELARKWLALTLTHYRKQGKHCIVFTHHAPSYLSADRTAYPDDPLDDAYYSDQTALFDKNPQLRLWAHGHTHRNCAYYVGAHNARVVSNQRGYATDRRARNFNPQAAEFELEAIRLALSR